MSKLKLELDALQVESFDTMSPESGVGTVVGQAMANHGNFAVYPSRTCDYAGTCAYESCMTDCGPTGNGPIVNTCEFMGTCAYESCMTDCGPTGNGPIVNTCDFMGTCGYVSCMTDCYAVAV